MGIKSEETPTERIPLRLLGYITGPGATRGEILLQFSVAIAAAVAIPAWALAAGVDWVFWQTIIASLVSFDLFGGIATNSTASAKRWFHRPSRTERHHLGFVLLHLHPFLIAGVFGVHDWLWAAWVYGFIAGGASVILASPTPLREPIALSLVGFATVGIFVGPEAPPFFDWILPVLALKLLAAHLLAERTPPMEFPVGQT